MTNRDPSTGKYVSKVNKLKAKKEQPKTLEQCTKHDLLLRIQEVMTRLMGKIPNDVISDNWDWDRFKLWVSEPFWRLSYEEYDDSREI